MLWIIAFLSHCGRLVLYTSYTVFVHPTCVAVIALEMESVVQRGTDFNFSASESELYFKIASSLNIALEKEMATHSSILAWRIPWTEEPGVGYSPQGRKESDTTEWLHFHFKYCMHVESAKHCEWDSCKNITHTHTHTHTHIMKE